MKAIKEYLTLLFTTKTGRTALGAIIATVIAYFNGAISPNEAVVAIFAAIQTVNLRHAVKKSGPENAAATNGGGTGN